jgi:hypothetical protein
MRFVFVVKGQNGQDHKVFARKADADAYAARIFGAWVCGRRVL